MSDYESGPVPSQIVLNKTRDQLTITFDTGKVFEYSTEFLRVYSPSAEVKGHGSEPRKIVPRKANVKILSIEQVGNYAVKFFFDDMHDTGIYSWGYLYEIGKDMDTLWADYLRDLDEKGLSRK